MAAVTVVCPIARVPTAERCDGGRLWSVDDSNLKNGKMNFCKITLKLFSISIYHLIKFWSGPQAQNFPILRHVPKFTFAV